MDFYRAVKYMDYESRKWLKYALEIHQPAHDWLRYL